MQNNHVALENLKKDFINSKEKSSDIFFFSSELINIVEKEFESIEPDLILLMANNKEHLTFYSNPKLKNFSDLLIASTENFSSLYHIISLDSPDIFDPQLTKKYCFDQISKMTNILNSFMKLKEKNLSFAKNYFSFKKSGFFLADSDIKNFIFLSKKRIMDNLLENKEIRYTKSLKV